MKKYEDIFVEVKDNFGYVEIQRPPNNFFDYLLIEQIADAYEELDQVSECRVVILSSQGKNFCAGANFGQDEDMLDKSVPYAKLYAQAVRLFKTKKPFGSDISFLGQSAQTTKIELLDIATLSYSSANTVLPNPQDLKLQVKFYKQTTEDFGEEFKGKFFINNISCNILGRVSMDLITIDESQLKDDQLYIGKPVEILGQNQTYADLAYETKTNEHEILISLGKNSKKVYI